SPLRRKTSVPPPEMRGRRIARYRCRSTHSTRRMRERRRLASGPCAKEARRIARHARGVNARGLPGADRIGKTETPERTGPTRKSRPPERKPTHPRRTDPAVSPPRKRCHGDAPGLDPGLLARGAEPGVLSVRLDFDFTWP